MTTLNSQPERLGFDALVEQWLDQSDYTNTTVTTYRPVLSELADRFDDPMAATSREVCDVVLLDAEGRRRTLAANTLKRYRTALSAFYGWAHDRGHVAVDHRPALRSVVLPCRRVRPGRWLTDVEARHLLATCDDTPRGVRDRALLTTALLSGLRAAELIGLTWGAVDLDIGRIRLVGKGRKVADVAIAEQARQALQQWRQLANTCTREEVRADWPVFCRSNCIGGLNGSASRYWFDWADRSSISLVRSVLAYRARLAGIGHVAPHDLRRSFAGFLDGNGIDLRTIQMALRHGSPETTVRCYLAPNPTRALQAVGALRL